MYTHYTYGSSCRTPRQGDAVALWCSLGQLLFHRKFHERRLESLHQSGGEANVATTLGPFPRWLRLLYQCPSQDAYFTCLAPWRAETITCSHLQQSIDFSLSGTNNLQEFLGHACLQSPVTKGHSFDLKPLMIKIRALNAWNSAKPSLILGWLPRTTLTTTCLVGGC